MDGGCAVSRIRVAAAVLKEHWFSDDATGMIHDQSTGEVVVQMADGSEYACSFEEHAAESGGTS